MDCFLILSIFKYSIGVFNKKKKSNRKNTLNNRIEKDVTHVFNHSKKSRLQVDLLIYRLSLSSFFIISCKQCYITHLSLSLSLSHR